MNRPSRDGICTITNWCPEIFGWRVGAWSSYFEAHGNGTFYSYSPQRVYIPPEAIDWLNGVRTPPPEPIKAGDVVRRAGDLSNRTVVHVHDTWAWISSTTVLSGCLAPVRDLTRIDDEAAG